MTDALDDTGWRASTVSALRTYLTYGLEDRSADIANEMVDAFASRFATEDVSFAAVALPADVYRCLTGQAAPARLLAGFSAAYLSIRVIDDIMDGDIPRFVGAERTPAEVLLLSQLLFGCAGQLMALMDRELAPTSGAILDVYRSTIAAMMEGQLADEQPLTASVTPADVKRKIELKSGAMLAGFAAIAAVAAGADAATVAIASNLGMHLAVCRQHQNDLVGLAADRSSDLRDSKATMALVLAMSRLEETDRVAFEAQLSAADGGADSISALISSNLIQAIKEVMVLAELHRDAASQALTALETGRSRCHLVHALVQAASVIED